MSDGVRFSSRPERNTSKVVLTGRKSGRRAMLVAALADELELTGGQAADFTLVGTASKQLLEEARAEVARRRELPPA